MEVPPLLLEGSLPHLPLHLQEEPHLWLPATEVHRHRPVHLHLPPVVLHLFLEELPRLYQERSALREPPALELPLHLLLPQVEPPHTEPQHLLHQALRRPNLRQNPPNGLRLSNPSPRSPLLA